MTYDLQQLRVFTAIVDSGSLGGASAALNVTQPALSRSVRRLEQQIGAPLFERHSKGMTLTDIGAALLPHATLLQREAERAAEEINALRGLGKGTVRVGAVGSIACDVLPMAVGRVLSKWPNLRVEVVEGVWDRLAISLVKHEVDLALAVDVPDTDEIWAIKDCRWEDCSFVVAATDHPLRANRQIRLADTLAQQWAIPPKGTGPYEHVASVFASRGLGLPNVVVETRSVTMLKSLVARSGFLSWMSESMYDAERKAGVIDALPIPGASAFRTLTAFQRRSSLLPAPSVKLLEELRAVISALRGAP